MTFGRSVPATLLVAAVAALAGCSGQGSGDFATVSGAVTHNGSPVEEAKVLFVSTTEVNGVAEQYSTTTDSSGKYMIGGSGDRPGIPPGRYKVVITKLRLKPGVQVPDDFDSLQLEMSGLGINTLPKEYSDVASTKLSAMLESGKNKDVNFDLKGK